MEPTESKAESRLATLGGGCFWCVEAVYDRVDGVLSVESGYAGGHLEDPTYYRVMDGTSGHAEVVQVRFDPERVSYEKLLEIFFTTHDPTTLNRQGADVGTQYRSVILHHDEDQRRTAERIKAALDEAGAFGAPIVTEIAPFTRFYPAEIDHQDYYARNPVAPYCRLVIAPKLERLEKVFPGRVKDD